jgi:hypothetical protein
MNHTSKLNVNYNASLAITEVQNFNKLKMHHDTNKKTQNKSFSSTFIFMMKYSGTGLTFIKNGFAN